MGDKRQFNDPDREEYSSNSTLNVPWNQKIQLCLC